MPPRLLQLEYLLLDRMQLIIKQREEDPLSMPGLHSNNAQAAIVSVCRVFTGAFNNLSFATRAACWCVGFGMTAENAKPPHAHLQAHTETSEIS